MNKLLLFLTLIITMPCTDLVAQVEDIKYTIGDTWTYERVSDFSDRLWFNEVIITDTLTVNDRSCFVIDNGLFGPDTMCVEDRKIYFWDYLLQGYQLQYDFGSESYASTYYNTQSDEIDSFYVYRDSVKTVLTSNGQFIDKYYFRSNWGYGGTASGSTIEAYEGIGRNYYHPHIPTGGIQITDGGVYNTVLRCFHTANTIYQFVDYSCDSIHMSVNVFDELDSSVEIYPNPTTGSFTLSGLDNGSYVKLYNIEGQLISMSVYTGTELYIDNPGIYFIKMRQRGKIVTQKIVVH